LISSFVSSTFAVISSTFASVLPFWDFSLAFGRAPVNTSTPVSVTSKVSSNCALRLPSRVTAVHCYRGLSISGDALSIGQNNQVKAAKRTSSGQCVSSGAPKQIIGSIVKVWPGLR
jgi:hypothetical protein